MGCVVFGTIAFYSSMASYHSAGSTIHGHDGSPDRYDGSHDGHNIASDASNWTHHMGDRYPCVAVATVGFKMLGG